MPVSVSRYQLKDDPHSSHSTILAMLGPGGGRRALDVGAADGFLAELLGSRGWVVTALERDPVQADLARGKCHEVIVADIADGTAKLSGLFDAIVCGDVLEHLTDPLSALASLNSRLSTGGRIVVSVPNVAHLWVRLSLLVGRFEYTDRGILDRTHVRFFTRRTLIAMLAQAGLSIEELQVTPVPLPLVVPRRLHGPWLDVAHGLSARAARIWPGGLAYQFVAACRSALARDPRPLLSAGRDNRAWAWSAGQEGVR
jgi:2-polyprenyl-3-methyl-5-hydroxy-6-metoxy-1,4-benzoquinol methylase